MLCYTLFAIVAPGSLFVESPVWSFEQQAPEQVHIDDVSVKSGDQFLFTEQGAAISGSRDSDWYQRVSSLYGLMLPLDTFPAMHGIDGGGKPSLDLASGRDSVTETLTGLQGGAVVRISTEVYASEGAALTAYYEKIYAGEFDWEDPARWNLGGEARVSLGTNVKSLLARVGKLCFEVTFAESNSAINKELMTSVANAVAFRAAHANSYTGVTAATNTTVVLKNGRSAAAKRVNGKLYVSATELTDKGFQCDSYMTATEKYCTIKMWWWTLRVDQFSWNAVSSSGRNYDMGAPAMPFDGDIWIPASLVTN